MIKTVAVPTTQTATPVKEAALETELKGGEQTNYLPDVGVKYDSQKTRFDLVDPEWEELLAEVMTFGASKYGDRNWEKGILVSRLYAASRRHIAAFIRGEDLDPESGKSHLAHANACLMMAWKMAEIHPELDDRNSVTCNRSVQNLDKAINPDANRGD